MHFTVRWHAAGRKGASWRKRHLIEKCRQQAAERSFQQLVPLAFRCGASIQKNRSARYAGSGRQVSFVVVALAALLVHVGSKSIFQTPRRLKVIHARTT